MRVDLFGVREGGDDRRPAASRRCGPRCPTLEPGKKLPARSGGPHAQAGPSLHAGHGRLERSLGRRRRSRAATASSAAAAAWTTTARSIPGRTSSTSSCSTATATASTAATRRTSSSPLYNHQIPPGAADVVHYGSTCPPDVARAVTVEVKLQLPQVRHDLHAARLRRRTSRTTCRSRRWPRDTRDLPRRRRGGDRARSQTPRRRSWPEWQRWNDYGIGLLRKGGKGEGRAAAGRGGVRSRSKSSGGPTAR